MNVLPKLFLALVFSVVSMLQAQDSETRIGLISGPGLSTLRTLDPNPRRPFFGFSGGLFFQQRLKPTIALELNLSYENKNFSETISMVDALGNVIGSFTARENYESLSIPLLLSWSNTGPTRILCNTGLYANYLLGYTLHTPGLLNQPEKTKLNINSSNRFDAGLVLGLGFCKKISQRVNLQFEFRNYIGLKTMQEKNQGKYSLNHHQLLFVVNYRISKLMQD